ncbi:MAG: hypothetical protein PHE55_16115 [Methylococcaceae bacterium]|nr:hypothetical protein [Methylococcaceae bacterium]
MRLPCAITRLTEYRQALITSALTGKIDVRTWQSEQEKMIDLNFAHCAI